MSEKITGHHLQRKAILYVRQWNTCLWKAARSATWQC